MEKGFLTSVANAFFARPGLVAGTAMAAAATIGAIVGMTDAGSTWMMGSSPFDVLPKSFAPLVMGLNGALITGAVALPGLFGIGLREAREAEAAKAPQKPMGPS